MTKFYGDFERGWLGHWFHAYPLNKEDYRFEKGNVFNPRGFETFGRKGWVGSLEYGEPEVKIMHASINPERVAGEAGDSVLIFTSSRIQDVGLRAQAEVGAGSLVELSALAHAWSNHEDENYYLCWKCFHGVKIPEGEESAICENCGTGINRDCELVFSHPHQSDWSEGVGTDKVAFYEKPPEDGTPRQDAKSNICMILGIDPKGGLDPYSDDVVWGDPVWAYNGFAEVPAVEVVAEADRVTLFLRSAAQYPFEHCDVYWDKARMSVTPAGEEEEEEEPASSYNYAHFDGSLIGIHGQQRDNIPEFTQEAPYHVVKVVDYFDWIADVEADVKIGRVVNNEIQSCQGVEGGDLNAMADDIIQLVLDKIAVQPELRDVIDYWEIVNEPDPPGAAGYAALAQLMIKCMEKAEAHGLKVALFSLNAGTPEWDEMKALVETGVFGRAKKGGHILALHEGTFGTHDPKYLWGDTIPGSPEVEGAGAMNFRYRYLYHLLKERDEAIPLVVSEWYCGDEQSATTKALYEALKWCDMESSKDYYFWGRLPFTLGPSGQWTHSDYERVYSSICDYNVAVAERQNATPPKSFKSVTARVPFNRTYALIWQIEDRLERLLWRIAIAIGTSATMRTVGHSADDAGIGPLKGRNILALNPSRWPDDLAAFYEEHYGGANYRVIETISPWEAALLVMERLSGDIALAQRDTRWAKYDFGEAPGGGTIGDYGCFLTGLAIILRAVYGAAITPEELDKILVNSQAAFVSDNLLMWAQAVKLFPVFDDYIKDNARWNATQLSTLLANDWQVILRRVSSTGSTHFVYLESVEGDVLHIIDTLDGKRERHYASEYTGIRAAHVDQEYLEGLDLDPTEPAPEPEPEAPLLGLHDPSGLWWMQENGVDGVGLTLHQVQTTPAQLDYTWFDGICIARLCWGWADGTGALPRREHKDAFVSAIVDTMLSAKGVDYFHVGNEDNNKREWPGFGTGDEWPLTPEYVVEIYNAIWDQVHDQVKMGPTPLDPYFGPGSDNSEWWEYILANIHGAHALFLHGKTQTNDPQQVWSTEMFGDEPLTWQYLNMRACMTYLAMVPERFQGLPVFVTECNPSKKSDGSLGWEAGNAQWIDESVEFFTTECPVTGVIYYRHPNADQFGLEDKPEILGRIKELA